VNRHAPGLVFVLVTALLVGFGRHPWSWIAGPIAAALVWSLDHFRPEREPAPVD
jgi:hypothetical protein